MKKTFYTLSNDLVFKNIYLKDEKMAKSLLECTMRLYDEEFIIKDINIKNTELKKDRLFIRNKNTDAIIETDKAYFNLELNNKFYKSVKYRNFFFHTSYLNSLIHVNENYLKIKKPVIQINYNIQQYKTKNEVNNNCVCNLETNEKYLNLFSIITIDIARILDKWYNELNQDPVYFDKYKHLLLIGMNEEQLKNLKVSDIMINKIIKKIFDLNKKPKFYKPLSEKEEELFMRNSLYEEGIEQGIEKGIEQGIEQGKIVGIEEEKKSTAIKMKQCNMSYDLISNITGLDKQKIASL